MRYLILLPLLLLGGCADSSRNLTVHLHDGASLSICDSIISPEVTKSATDERATNTPDIAPDIPGVLQ